MTAGPATDSARRAAAGDRRRRSAAAPRPRCWASPSSSPSPRSASSTSRSPGRCAGDGRPSASGSPRSGWSRTSSSASSRRTPTRCCCPPSRCWSGWAWRSSTGSTSPPSSSTATSPTREDAPRPALWATLGVVAVRGRPVVVRDHRALSRFAYTLALVGMALLALPAAAAVVDLRGQRRQDLDPGGRLLHPAGRVRQDLPGRLLRRLPGRQARRPRPGQPPGAGLELPRGRDLGPVLVAWVLSILVLVFERDLGSSLLLFGIFVVMLYVATERSQLAAHRRRPVRRRRADRLPALRPRPGRAWTPGCDPFAYHDGAGYQLVQSLFGLGTGGLFGAGLGGGRPDQVPCAKSDFISPAVGEELGLFGLVARDRRLPDPRRARPAHLADRPGRVRQAARRRPGVRRRLAGVRRPRRRHRAAAADRPDHAVPRLRRLVAGGQLRRWSRCWSGSATPPAVRPPRAPPAPPPPLGDAPTEVVQQ